MFENLQAGESIDRILSAEISTSDLAHHPNEEIILRFAERTANAAEVLLMEGHIARCEACRTKLEMVTSEAGSQLEALKLDSTGIWTMEQFLNVRSKRLQRMIPTRISRMIKMRMPYLVATASAAACAMIAVAVTSLTRKQALYSPMGSASSRPTWYWYLTILAAMFILGYSLALLLDWNKKRRRHGR